MDPLRDAQQLLEMASATDAPYARELRNIARRILLDVAETLAPILPPELLTPPRLESAQQSAAVHQTPPAAPTSLIPPPAPLRPTARPTSFFAEPPSPIPRFPEMDSEDENVAQLPPASVMTGTTAARSRKNFAKFVRTLHLENDTEFFYGSVKFLLAGAGTSTPTLTFVHNGMRISSPAPSGIISQYEKLVNNRTVAANGWDRLKMLDGEDRPRSLSWEGWDMIL
jgi:hypothetical protein